MSKLKSVILIMMICLGSARSSYAIAPLNSDLSRKQIDSDLQEKVMAGITDRNLQQAVADKKIAIALVDVTDIEKPRMALVNADNTMYAASLPKIAILFGAFEQAEKGLFDLSPENRESLGRMIRYSNNRDASAMISKVGIRYLTELLQSEPYHFYSKKSGGLWAGALYNGGRTPKLTIRDPLYNLSHAATAFQVARYFYLIQTGQLVSPKASLEMKEILSKPGVHHYFVKALSQIDPSAQIYRKSGTLALFDTYADGGIIERNGKTYIAVMITHSPKSKAGDSGKDWIAKIFPVLDQAIFAP